jgi:hypothetical protein
MAEKEKVRSGTKKDLIWICVKNRRNNKKWRREIYIIERERDQITRRQKKEEMRLSILA